MKSLKLIVRPSPLPYLLISTGLRQHVNGVAWFRGGSPVPHYMAGWWGPGKWITVYGGFTQTWNPSPPKMLTSTWHLSVDTFNNLRSFTRYNVIIDCITLNPFIPFPCHCTRGGVHHSATGVMEYITFVIIYTLVSN